MSNTVIDYLLFCGLGLYAMTSLLFFYLWLRTLWTKDGVGLIFLKLLTFSLFVGSFVITILRIDAMYFSLDPNVSRAIAIINPITLLAVGLYLNYLFHQKYKKK